MVINDATFSIAKQRKNLSRGEGERKKKKTRPRVGGSAEAAALIKHSTRSGPSSRSGCVNNWAHRGLPHLKVLGGSQARTKGNEGAPRRVSDTRDRVSRPRGRGADREHGGCQVEVNGCSPRGKRTQRRAATLSTRRRSRRKNAGCRVWPIPFFYASSRSTSSSFFPLSFSLFLFSFPLLSSPASFSWHFGSTAIGHSWPGSMMLAARV